MPLRCVLVDDNPGFLEVARSVLEQEGLEVVGVASTPAEAAQVVGEMHPDVTLVDVDLGEDSGIELVRLLADDPDIDPGRLILMSAHGQDDLLDLIEESPAIGFLGKPMLSAAAIQQLLDAGGGCGDRFGEPIHS